MSKINKLLEWAVKKPLLSTKLSSLSKAIEKVLNAHRLANLEETIDTKIASLAKTEREKIISKTLTMNAVRYMAHTTTATTLPMQNMVIDASISASLSLTRGIGEIVGFQPMRGPVGLIYTLRYKDLDNPKKMCLEVVSEAVEAKSRKLKASWALEAQQDMMAIHGKDITEEISKATGNEIIHEITAEILHRIILNSDTKTIKIPNLDSVNVDDVRKLTVSINMAANQIAGDTRRGAGNILVCGLEAISLLQMLPTGFVPSTEVPHSTYLAKAGTLNDCFTVYSSTVLPLDMIIVGYKGAAGDTDAGITYSPYLLGIPSGLEVDPTTFEPRIGFVSRYDIKTHKKEDGEDSKYYQIIKLVQE